MKVAIVVFVIGDKYINMYNTYYKLNLEQYCKKHNYDLIILNELIQKEDNLDKKNFFGIDYYYLIILEIMIL